MGSEFMTQNWSMARKCALDVFCSFCFSSNCPSTNCDSCKTRIKRRRQRRAGVGHVADQRQRDGIAVHVRPSTRHSVPQFAHEQRGLICREEAVGVVVVEAEYAFDLRLAFRERSQGRSTLGATFVPQFSPKTACRSLRREETGLLEIATLSPTLSLSKGAPPCICSASRGGEQRAAAANAAASRPLPCLLRPNLRHTRHRKKPLNLEPGTALRFSPRVEGSATDQRGGI